MAVERIRMDQITVPKRHREDMGDIPAFAARIKERGMINPITVKKTKTGYKLLAGERRFRGSRHNGESMIWANVLQADSRLDELLLERDENEDRKPMTDSERVKLANEIKEIIGSRQGKKGDSLLAGLPEVDGKDTRDMAAELAGFTSTTAYRQAAQVVANGTPDLIAAMDDETVTRTDAAAVSVEPPEVQDAAVEAVLSGEATTATEAVHQREPGDDSDNDLDGWGIPIQPHAVGAFASVPEFDELISLLRKADKLYSKLAESDGGAYLRRPGVSINAKDRWKHSGIKTAIANVEDCKPTYTICPYEFNEHLPHGDDCSLCHGLNWVRTLGKEETHQKEEMIAKAKEVLGVHS